MHYFKQVYTHTHTPTPTQHTKQTNTHLKSNFFLVLCSYIHFYHFTQRPLQRLLVYLLQLVTIIYHPIDMSALSTIIYTDHISPHAYTIQCKKRVCLIKNIRDGSSGHTDFISGVHFTQVSQFALMHIFV